MLAGVQKSRGESKFVKRRWWHGDGEIKKIMLEISGL